MKSSIIIFNFFVNGSLSGSSAFLPPTIESIPPNCDPSIASTRPRKTLSKSIFSIIFSDAPSLLSNKNLFI